MKYNLFLMHHLNLDYHRGSSLALLNLPLPADVCLAKCLSYIFLMSPLSVFSAKALSWQRLLEQEPPRRF